METCKGAKDSVEHVDSSAQVTFETSAGMQAGP